MKILIPAAFMCLALSGCFYSDDVAREEPFFNVPSANYTLNLNIPDPISAVINAENTDKFDAYKKDHNLSAKSGRTPTHYNSDWELDPYYFMY